MEIPVSLEGVEALSSRDLELVEALSILEEIKKNPPENDVILYKKLKPSLIMMGLLIQNNISFTAQVKVPYLEDPILAIFLNLIERHFNESKLKDESLVFTLIAYFEIIGLRVEPEKIKNEVAKFDQATPYFGLYQAFVNFISNLGIFNSNYKNNISFIENICRLYSDDLEQIISVVSAKESESYSLDFNFADNPSSLNLMSAHASKGLEFSTVYLGGIYTNGSSRSDSSIVGKFPLSFIWKDDLHSKKKFLTPQLMLEREISKRKDFSESKRLFYVASTRAENGLKWVNINLEKIKTRNPGHHWIKGLNSWKEDNIDKDEINDLVSDKLISLNEMSLDSSLRTRPLFQIDEVGITLNSLGLEKIIMPELSVTRLAILHDCPRKFYLKNILKIDIQKEHSPNFFEEEVPEVKSSSSRGTQIHDEISQVILNNFSTQDLELSYQKTYTWVLDKLMTFLDKYELISEKSIKFEVFGHMISGIPDLILFPKDEECELEVWDFKSGKSKNDEDSSYHFQLYCYAYSQYILGNYSKDKLSKLVLCYIDEKRLVDKTVSFLDVENYLRSYWQKANSPWITNTDMCESCEFNELCE